MLLSVENASFSYRANLPPVFEDVSFSLREGEILAILGPNGAGKTTLLRCMTGMLRWTKGRTALDGVDIRRLNSRQLWSRLSYVPQARSSAAAYTGLETVLLGRTSRLSAFAEPGKKDVEKAEETLDALRISHLAGRLCTEMSGGEMQMLLIARALVSDPEVLILDEPESSLDFRNQLIILDAISSLAEKGIACVFNTHYPDHALSRANKSLILSGHRAVFGPTDSVLTEEAVERAFGVKAVIGEIGSSGVRTVAAVGMMP